jgi:hypothetical protein
MYMAYGIPNYKAELLNPPMKERSKANCGMRMATPEMNTTWSRRRAIFLIGENGYM